MDVHNTKTNILFPKKCLENLYIPLDFLEETW